MKAENKSFYQVIRTVDRGHRHYTYSVKTFMDEQVALRWASRWCLLDSYSILKISTYKTGAIHCEIIR